MYNTLYLDTARLGQMSQRACDASVDFARFANEHGCTLYFSNLLKDGFANWPSALQHQYRGLSNWNGVSRFQAKLQTLAEANQDSEVLLTSRPATLMKFAARLLGGPCRNVLTTDTCWPAYKRILSRELSGTATRFTEVPIRRKLLRQSMSADAIIEFLTRQFVRHQCDGLFVPLVDNLGVRLPVERLVQRIRQQAKLRFVVVDGAQSIGHVPLRLEKNYCDFLVAGSHKWLRAFYTMGIGFFGNPTSRAYIAEALQRWRQAGIVDDPLLEFSDELITDIDRPFGETVQVAPLFIANAATAELLSQWPQAESVNASNRKTITRIAHAANWSSIVPDPSMASKILLFENITHREQPRILDNMRQSLMSLGVAVTVYSNGLLRLSLPDQLLDCNDQDRLAKALSIMPARRTSGRCDNLSR